MAVMSRVRFAIEVVGFLSLASLWWSVSLPLILRFIKHQKDFKEGKPTTSLVRLTLEDITAMQEWTKIWKIGPCLFHTAKELK